MTNLTAISLFSGAVDGLGIAAHVAGFTVTHHYEIDSWCCSVLHKNFPHSTIVQQDIKHVTSIPTADVLLGSPPCQGWSNAGNGRGADDPRNLWPDMLRLVQQSRPRCVLVENVRGGVSKGYIDLVCGDLEAAGYTAQALVYPACVVGAPHIRERVFVVAHAAIDDQQNKQTSGNNVKQRAVSHRCHSITKWDHPGGFSREYDCTSNSDVFNPSRSGRQEFDTARVASDAGHSTGRPDSHVLNPTSAGLYQPQPAERRAYSTQTGAGVDNRSERSSAVRQSEGLRKSRMVGSYDGPASGLDSITANFPGFPNYMGLPQHAHEPARTISKKVTHHKDRIQALGNAVVWQQAYPLTRAIMRWLEVQS